MPLRLDTRETGMRLERFSFGSLRIDDVTYRQDVVIDRGKTGTLNIYRLP
jgi:hypothetical protein